jgi:hypothetical protein
MTTSCVSNTTTSVSPTSSCLVLRPRHHRNITVDSRSNVVCRIRNYRRQTSACRLNSPLQPLLLRNHSRRLQSCHCLSIRGAMADATALFSRLAHSLSNVRTDCAPSPVCGRVCQGLYRFLHPSSSPRSSLHPAQRWQIHIKRANSSTRRCEATPQGELASNFSSIASLHLRTAIQKNCGWW